MLRQLPIALFLGASLALCAELPITDVTLYKHGVGFFSRTGKLEPGQAARLEFDAGEMNDVLKSLTVWSRGAGKITGLRYDAYDTLQKKLASLPFQLGEAQPLALVLDGLKGARIELRLGNEALAGSIVGGRLGTGERSAEHEQVTVLTDAGDLRTIELSAVQSLRFSDAKLQQQFRDYLAAISSARSKDKRGVTIEGDAREITASYLIPAAVWKSSYRLLLGEAKPTLEGWAIVDNTSSEDWSRVSLAVVSGRPISFVSQLYAPKYVTRATAALADDVAAAPVLHEEGFEEAPAAMGKGGGVGSGSGGVWRGIGGGAPAPAAAPPPPRMALIRGKPTAETMARIADTASNADARSSIASTASGRDLGDLFEYRIAQPVTIRKGESAMLPFLQQAIEARRLLIYSDHNSANPTSSAELTNTSGKTLDGGPITVYDGGAYGGEALMETLKAGDKRLISYAVDLGTRVTEAFGSQQAVTREVHASRGVLTSRVAAEETRTYTIRNVDPKAKTLILEHPLRPGYELLGGLKPTEKTAQNYRFEIALAAGATKEFAVKEERVYDQTAMVTSMTPDTIVEFVRNRTLSEAARTALQGIAEKKRQIAENDRSTRDAESQMRDFTGDEDRIRRNIESLNRVAGQQEQVQTYARQLAASEQQIAALRDRQAELQRRATTLAGELDKLVSALSF